MKKNTFKLTGINYKHGLVIGVGEADRLRVEEACDFVKQMVEEEMADAGEEETDLRAGQEYKIVGRG